MFESPLVTAFVFGLISAVSLPLGAVTARFWAPRDKIIAALMAFGAGALLSALTIDLVGEALHRRQFVPLAAGALAGGFLFAGLNQVLNGKGAFLRKPATTLRYLRRLKARKLQTLFRRLSEIPLFNELPPEEIAALVPYIDSRVYKNGSTIIRQGEPGDSLFIVEEGSVDIIDFRRGTKLASLGAGEVFGEMSLITGEPRSATAVASAETRLWLVWKDSFDRLINTSPSLFKIFRRIAAERITSLKTREVIPREDADRWFEIATRHLDEEHCLPTTTEIREAASAHSHAPLAIWLGILLDGIPESLVIGSSMIHSSVSLSLIAGLFLSNYPEALSSSVSMRQNNYSFSRILTMWTSLMVLTGVGALIGNLFFVGMPPALFTLIEGVAAGAMLTMIAETMLPEAYNKGGSITGLATLFGFLSAIMFKMFE
jgi:CRP-like cAMP-binding protein